MTEPLHAVSPRPIDSLTGRRLLVLLHGYGADERDLLPLAAELDLPDAVIALRAPIDLGPGAAWFDGPRDEVLRGSGLDQAAGRVLDLLDALAADRGAPGPVRLLGFSQGGAVAMAALRRDPQRFDRVVLLSGFTPQGAEPGDEALRTRPATVFWGRGDADEVIPPDAVARTAAWLAAHAEATVRVYPGLGHAIAADEVLDVRAFLA